MNAQECYPNCPEPVVFNFSCVVEKTRFEIIEDLAIAGKVDVTFVAETMETRVTVSPVGSGNFTIVEWPTEGNLSTMPEPDFLVVKGRIEDAVEGYLTTFNAELRESRLLKLNEELDEIKANHPDIDVELYEYTNTSGVSYDRIKFSDNTGLLPHDEYGSSTTPITTSPAGGENYVEDVEESQFNGWVNGLATSALILQDKINEARRVEYKSQIDSAIATHATATVSITFVSSGDPLYSGPGDALVFTYALDTGGIKVYIAQQWNGQVIEYHQQSLFTLLLNGTSPDNGIAANVIETQRLIDIDYPSGTPNSNNFHITDFEHDPTDDEIERAKRLKFVDDVLADGNVTFEVTQEQFASGLGDVFTFSYEGVELDANDEKVWTRSTAIAYAPGVIELMSLDEADYINIFFLFDQLLINARLAQAEYDRIALLNSVDDQISSANASNSLYNQTQSDLDAMTDDEIREARKAEFIAITDDNTVTIQPQWLNHKSSYGVSITIRGNILETILAKDYGNPGLNLMTVEEFNAYYVACWLFIDNTL